MRPTLLGSLLDAARHNVAPQRARPRAVRVGHRLPRAASDAEPAADEHHALGALLSGALAPRSWRGERRAADFFAAKALLGALLDALRTCDWSVEPAHAGRSCTLGAARR